MTDKPSNGRSDSWWSDTNRLNRDAMQALRGLSSDWVRDLTALLRSDAPISRLVRHALADAIDPASPWKAKLEMRGHKKLRDQAKSYECNVRDFAIGKWMEERLRDGICSSVEDAALDAAEDFGVDSAVCAKARQYHLRAMAWVESAREPGTHFGDLPEDRLIEMFHGWAAEKRQPPANPTVSDDEWVLTLLNHYGMADRT